jgi:hypothetical protein
MKATLTFTLPEEREEFEAACHSQLNSARLDDVWTSVFRPAFKHGYSGLHAEELNQLLNEDTATARTAYRVIELLAARFQFTGDEA